MNDDDFREHPAEASQAVLAELLAKADYMSTEAFTNLAHSLGVTAPSDEAGWSLCMIFNPDGSEAGLFWAPPGEAA